MACAAPGGDTKATFSAGLRGTKITSKKREAASEQTVNQ